MEKETKPPEEKSAEPTSSTSMEDITEVINITEDELDPTSEQFNALKALYNLTYRLTKEEPEVVYQNMAALETRYSKWGILGLITSKDSPPSGSIDNQPSGSKDNQTTEMADGTMQTNTPLRRFKDHQLPIKSQVKSRHERNLIQQMNQYEGPLNKLLECVENKQRVKVVIRNQHGIKGFVKGIVQMFDRHWNLLMIDAEESLVLRNYKYAEDKLVTHQESQDCSSLLNSLGINLPKENKKRLSRKKVHITRSLPQLMIRGEHIALIFPIAEPKSIAIA